jgi:hypothetical protein
MKKYRRGLFIGAFCAEPLRSRIGWKAGRASWGAIDANLLSAL